MFTFFQNKIILIFVLIGVFILTVAAIFYFQKPNSTITISSSPDIKIEVLKGMVEILKINQEQKIITDNFILPLNEIEKIRTQKNTLALIILPDNTSLKIDENSEIDRLELAEQKTQIGLVKGRILVRIYKILDKGETFEVKTSNLVAAVRGTVFSIAFKQNKSEVAVFQNKIEIEALDPQTQKPILGVAPIILQSMEKTAVDMEKPPTKEKPMEILKISPQELEQLKKEEFFQSETIFDKTIFEEIIKPIFQESKKQEPLLPSVKPIIEEKSILKEESKIGETAPLLTKKLVDFEISPSQSGRIQPGAKIQFKINGIYNDGSRGILTSALLIANGIEIIWYIEGAPGIGKIDENGYFIAGPYGGKGEVVADFSKQEAFLKSIKATIEVEAPAAPPNYQEEPRG